ncbi:MAG: hypothetical protein P8Y53_23900, partial [Pseudolabrys sp.]
MIRGVGAAAHGHQGEAPGLDQPDVHGERRVRGQIIGAPCAGGFGVSPAHQDILRAGIIVGQHVRRVGIDAKGKGMQTGGQRQLRTQTQGVRVDLQRLEAGGPRRVRRGQRLAGAEHQPRRAEHPDLIVAVDRRTQTGLGQAILRIGLPAMAEVEDQHAVGGTVRIG